MQRVYGAQQRQHHDGTENEVAVMTENAFGSKAQREVIAGDFIHGQHVQDGSVNEQINANDGEQAGENGARNQEAGIDDFVAEIDNTIPAIVGVYGGLEAEEERGEESGTDGNGERRAALREGRSRFRSLMKPATKSEASDHDDQEREALQNRRGVLNFAPDTNAFPLQQGEEDNDGDGSDFDSERAIESRNEMSHVFADDDGNDRGCAAIGEPVGPADYEAGEIADAAAREIVLATASGNGGAEFGELEGADESVESAAEPNTEEQPATRKTRGDVAGGADNASGDGVADGDSNAETDTENLQERALFFSRMRRT